MCARTNDHEHFLGTPNYAADGGIPVGRQNTFRMVYKVDSYQIFKAAAMRAGDRAGIRLLLDTREGSAAPEESSGEEGPAFEPLPLHAAAGRSAVRQGSAQEARTRAQGHGAAGARAGAGGRTRDGVLGPGEAVVPWVLTVNPESGGQAYATRRVLEEERRRLEGGWGSGSKTPTSRWSPLKPLRLQRTQPRGSRLCRGRPGEGFALVSLQPRGASPP